MLIAFACVYNLRRTTRPSAPAALEKEDVLEPEEEEEALLEDVRPLPEARTPGSRSSSSARPEKVLGAFELR